MTILRFVLALILLTNITVVSFAQNSKSPSFATEKVEKKPYKVLTSGKQITVKATSQIKTIMVWTSSGHRIVEQKAVNANSVSFNVTVNEKIVFMMLRI
jgi:hypothetical protein